PFSLPSSLPRPAWSPNRSLDWSAFILSAAEAALPVSPRPSNTPHDRTLTIFGIETMDASSVRSTRIDGTLRSPVSSGLSNCDQIAEMFGGMIAMLSHRDGNTGDAQRPLCMPCYQGGSEVEGSTPKGAGPLFCLDSEHA